MRIVAAALLSLLVLLPVVGCTSSTASIPDQVPASLIEPAFKIRQVVGQAFAARHESGPISVKFELDVLNRSSEPLTLERVQLESVGYGAYTLRRSSVPFEKVIQPRTIETVELWAPAYAESTISGSNGPVTVRAIAYFDSPVGRFQKIFVQQVNAGDTGPLGAQ